MEIKLSLPVNRVMKIFKCVSKAWLSFLSKPFFTALQACRNASARQSVPGFMARDIDEHVMMEIMSHVPVNCVLNFKCVSKAWLSLLSDPYFTALHARRNASARRSEHGVILNLMWSTNDVCIKPHRRCSSVVPNPSLSFLPSKGGDGGSYTVMASCNGLALLQWHQSAPLAYSYFYLCNPTTMHYSFVRHPGPGLDVITMGIAFDPSASPHSRLACIVVSSAPTAAASAQVLVYTDGIWRPTAHPAPEGLLESFIRSLAFWSPSPAFWNGAINWATSGEWFLSLDMELERVRRLPLPPSQMMPYYFGESRGHLHVVLWRSWGMDVMEMRPDWSGWSLLYRVFLSDLHGFKFSMLASNNFPFVIRGTNSSTTNTTAGSVDHKIPNDNDDELVFVAGEWCLTYNLSKGASGEAVRWDHICYFPPVLPFNQTLAPPLL